MAKHKVGRRGFLKGAAAGAAAVATQAKIGRAQDGQAGGRGAAAPAQTALAREAGNVRPTAAALRVIDRPGSDFMVDVLKTLNIEYLAANPGSTFESLHESLQGRIDNLT